MKSPGLNGDEEGGKREWMRDENVRKWDAQVGRGMEWESSERETMGFGRNLVIGKFSAIHNNDSS